MATKPIHPNLVKKQNDLAIPSLLQLANKDKKLIALISFILMGWTSCYIWFLYKPQYQADAKVIIKDSAITSRYIEPESSYKLQTTSSNNANPVFNTMELLYSTAISDSLYTHLHNYHPQELEQLQIKTIEDWREFYKDGKSFIKASNKAGTDIISVSFTWPDATISQDGLTEILKAFQESSLKLNASEYTIRKNYIQRNISEISAKLQALRNEKSNFKKDKLVIDIGRASSDLEANRLTLKNQINQIESEMRGKQAEKTRYQKLLNMDSNEALLASSIGQNAHLAELQNKLYELNEKYAQMSNYYTDNNPNVTEVKSQLDQVQVDIEKELKRSLGQQYADKTKSMSAINDANRTTLIGQMISAEAGVLNLQEQSKNLQHRLGEIEQRMQAVPTMAVHLSNIEEEEASLSSALSALRERMAEFTLREAQTVSNVFVFNPPVKPTKAKAPSEKHLLLLGFIASVIVSLTTVYLKDRIPRQLAKREAASVEGSLISESETNGKKLHPSPVA